MRRFFTLFLFLICTFQLGAQVFAPDLLCIRNDSLFWDIPTNNCGAFVSYDVYASMDPNGPYTLVAELLDVNSTDFFHQNIGGIWYYYLESSFDCPGEIVLASDTLDNLQPSLVVLQTASVNDNNVELNWAISTDPEVIGYIIYRETNIGVIPIDTIYGGTFYLDEGASPTTQGESYYILALDACGGTSIFNDFHKTIFLEGDVNSCDDFISLDWSPYIGWSNGIEKQEIWLSINGNTATNVGEVTGSQTNFQYTELTDGDIYCFSIVAIETGTNNQVISNEICLTLDVVQSINNLDITNTGVLSSEEIALGWTWNTNAEINQYQIEYSENGVDYLPLVGNEIMPPLPLDFNISGIYPEINPMGEKYFFRVSTIDDCDRRTTSTYGSTIFLKATDQANSTNLVQWTALDIENAVPTQYELFRIVNGNSTSLAILDAAVNQFIDQVDASAGLAEICYKIHAQGSLTLSSGEERITYSSSNMACAEQQAVIYVPNAFAPTGANRIFKPVVLFGENLEYSMSIYDRYGQQVFKTEDLNEAWDGNVKSRHATQGIYVYHIVITQLDGRITEKKGTVLLIR